jgi:hypothetical protein
MRFRLFQYTLPAGEDLADLNAFLASERVAAVSHHVVPHAGGPLLVFVVETAGVRPNAQGPRVDTVHCEVQSEQRPQNS